MKTPSRSEQPPHVDLDAVLARVRLNGLEAGWTKADDWSPLVADALRSELSLLLSRQLREMPVDVGVLTARRDRLAGLRQEVDARRAAYCGRMAGAMDGRGVAAASFGTSLRRAVAHTALLGLAGLAAGAAGLALGWKGWLMLFLAGILLQIRPWGVAAGARALAVASFAGVGYLHGAWRAGVLARRLDAVDQELELENLRRAQSERWVAERVEWLLGQYMFAKGRGDKARVIAAEVRI